MRLIALIMVLAMLTACGQKGPLYLPEDEPVQASASTPETAVPEETDKRGK